MPDKDYYKILGVKPDASEADIKKAFRKLAKDNHPDAHPGDKKAEARFKEVSQAHEVLSKPEKRKQYDQMREAAKFGFGGGGPKGFSFTGAQPGGGGKSAKFEDLFGLGGLGDVFSSMFEGGGPGAAQRKAQQGEDAVCDIQIPLTLAVSGGKQMVTVPLGRPCSACSGTGAKPGTQPQTCLKCGGTGKITLSQGAFGVSRPCPVCYGRGKIIPSPCLKCSGAGKKTVQKKVNVTVPPGVSDGAKLRLAGQGHAASGSGPRGDLVLVVCVQPDSTFSRKGNDLYCDAVINIAQAVLGGTISVRTIEGSGKLKVPPGVSSGSKLRLRGQGVKTKSGQRGDLYVTVKVDVPKNVSSQQKKTFLAFADAMGFDH